MAQQVEHVLGKDEVPGSNPGISSKQTPPQTRWVLYCEPIKGFTSPCKGVGRECKEREGRKGRDRGTEDAGEGSRWRSHQGERSGLLSRYQLQTKPTSNEVGFILRAGQGNRLAVIVAKYRSVGFCGGARAPRPTEAGNDISNEYLPAGSAIAYLPTVARRRADEERPYLFYRM